MAEGFEPYHVPQQSRRDKLRVNNQPPGCVDNIQGCAALVPLYDPSLISSDLINCDANVHRQSFGVKEEGMNLMGFSGQGIGANNHMYLDPQLSVHLNPSTIQDISNSSSNPYAYFRGILDHHHHQSIQEPINSSCNNSGQSLSLSLSSHPSAHNLPLELNLHRYDSNSMFDNNSSSNNNGNKVSGGGFFVACNNGGSTTIELSKSAVPLGPFTGYASVLRGSRFLKPAQQLLEELCDVGRGIYAEKNGGADSSLLDPPLENFDDSLNSSDGSEQTRKKSRLLSMLDEVYKRYKQYYQQMQTAVAAFESVAGLSNAAPFANLALKAMSKHFRCLKNAITAQLQFTSKSHGKIHSEISEDTQRMDTCGRGTFGQRPFQGAGFVDQPVWRPQRGLPERAVTVLRAWLFEHFLHPYPTDTDKILLAKQTGLSRNQVSNWFINARVRLWKPMVEEIHMLETRQAQKPSSQRDEEQAPPPPPPTTQTNQIESENASTSFHRIGDTFPNLKRTRDDPNGRPMKTPYENLLQNNHPHSGIGVSNGGVSLTLGLHQNGGVGLSDSYPMNAARRFGLDSSHGGEGFVVSGFTAQNRQFGRDHHQIIEGQLMHDFVG